MDLKQKFIGGTNVVVSYHAAMEVMSFTDKEQRQFFEKIIMLEFSEEEIEYGVSVDCDKAQKFFEIYIEKDVDENNEPLYHLVEVNPIDVDDFLDLYTEQKAI